MENFEILKKNDGYELVIYIECFDCEFGEEFLTKIKMARKSLFEEIAIFFKKNNNLNIKRIRFVVGTMIVLTIPLNRFIITEGDNISQSKAFNMSYVYFGNKDAMTDAIVRAENYLDTVSPSYFDITSDGTLKVNAISTDFIDTVHVKGIKIVPFVSNHFNRDSGIKALSNMDEIIDGIANTIEQYDLDGINVDIENVTQNERDAYTEFVKRLRERIPEHKEVSVAVAANPRNFTVGWQGSYDYEKLAEYADYLMIMAYDEHYQNGPVGAVASYGFVEKSIQYALKRMPAEKIVLGMNFYGRIWSDDGKNIATGNGVSLQKAATIIDTYHATLFYDNNAKAPYAKFTVRANDPQMSVGGTVLKQGSYIMYYENELSLKEKLSLVGEYGLKGTGSWSLGQETQDVWDYYSLWMNSKYISDISGYFAKDDIIDVVLDGIMVGISDTQFDPQGALTRAQASAILRRTLNLPDEEVTLPFNDVDGHWAYKDIQAIYQAGLIIGYDDFSFKPDEPMTREEIATLLYRVSGNTSELPNIQYFYDVESDRWSYHEISIMAGLGILKGYQDESFKPTNIITRGEMAVLIERIRGVLLK